MSSHALQQHSLYSSGSALQRQLPHSQHLPPHLQQQQPQQLHAGPQQGSAGCFQAAGSSNGPSSRGAPSQPPVHSSVAAEDQVLPPCHTIYVSGIDPGLEDQQLQQVFEVSASLHLLRALDVFMQLRAPVVCDAAQHLPAHPGSRRYAVGTAQAGGYCSSRCLWLLQMCGDIRTLYTGRKHDGFVLITYFDGHGGNFAKAAMQGKQLMGRAIHIELSQPGQNAHDKDTQAGEQPRLRRLKC